MPNHVTTRCMVTGPAEDVAAFRDACIREKTWTDDFTGKTETWTTLDFEAVIPVPDGMNDVVESGDLSFWLELFELEQPKFFPLGQAGALARIKQMGHAALAKSAANFALAWEMLENHGARSWYEWNIANWGTKWGAYSFSVVSDAPGALDLKFDTAWAFPEPIFRKLMELYPSLTFAIDCFDEGWNFAGTGAFGPVGNCTYQQEKATDELYERVYGRKPEREEEEA